MMFGWLPPEKLDGLNLSLPPDPPGNATVLAGGRAAGALVQAYVGLAEWRVKEWVGRFYPPKTKEVLWMDHYVQSYNALEFNATHYRIYAPEDIRRWAYKATAAYKAAAANKAAGDSEGSMRPFQFLPKMLQDISHRSGFTRVEEATAAYLESVTSFGAHLGPVFIQTSEAFAPYPPARRALFAWLASLPNELRFFVEFRHPGWTTDAAVRAETFAALRALAIGAVITDTPGRRDVCHMELSVPEVFIRFVAKSRHPTTYARIDAWAARLKLWIDAGLRSFHFIVHTGQSAPETSAYVVHALSRDCGVALTPPHLSAPLFDAVAEAAALRAAP